MDCEVQLSRPLRAILYTATPLLRLPTATSELSSHGEMIGFYVTVGPVS